MPVGSPTTWRTMQLPDGTTGRSVFMQGPTRVGQLELLQWDLPVNGTTARRGRRPGPRGPLVLSEAWDPEIYERLVSMGVRCYTGRAPTC